MKLKKTELLKDDQVHIWSASLSEVESDISYFVSILSEDELEKAHRFRFREHKVQYIISRGILRCLLGGYLNENPKAIKINYKLWGKPHLLKEEPLNFNISHSKDYVLFAFTKKYQVGIDLEYIDKYLPISDIALNLFSQRELNYWKKLDLKDQIFYFFKLWVCKEAFLKASGKGLVGLQKESIWENLGLFTNQQIFSLSGKKMVLPYYFECIPEYASALFVKGPPLHLLYKRWKIQ